MENGLDNQNNIDKDTVLEGQKNEDTQTAVPADNEAGPALVKKTLPKKTLYMLLAAAAVLVIVIVVLFVAVIRPNSIYNSAEQALSVGNLEEAAEAIGSIPNHKDADEFNERLTYAKAEQAFEDGDLNETERLLAVIPDYEQTASLSEKVVYERADNLFDNEKYDAAEEMLLTIPNFDDTQELLDDICYQRAVMLADDCDFAGAQDLLDSIPGHDDPEDLKSLLCYNNALQMLETGDYVGADELLNTIPDYEDSAQLREAIFDEAMALKCILDYRPKLKDPSSIQIVALYFYDNAESENNIPAILFEAAATNSYGGMVSSYILYEDDFEYYGYCNSLYPSTNSWSDWEDYLEVINAIIIRGYLDKTSYGTFDIDRINRLLAAGVEFNIDLDFATSEVEL